MARKPKKLAGIDRRGENAWRIRYVKDGKRHAETVTGTQEDAIARRDVIRAEIAQSTWTAPASMTVGEWAATWAEHLRHGLPKSASPVYGSMTCGTHMRHCSYKLECRWRPLARGWATQTRLSRLVFTATPQLMRKPRQPWRQDRCWRTR